MVEVEVVKMDLVKLGFTMVDCHTFRKWQGSVSNGTDITIRFKKVVSYDRMNDMATIKGNIWRFDGDNIEYENTFDITTRADKVVETYQMLK